MRVYILGVGQSRNKCPLTSRCAIPTCNSIDPSHVRRSTLRKSTRVRLNLSISGTKYTGNGREREKNIEM